MTNLGEARRATRSTKWLVEALVVFIVFTWCATIYAIAAFADGVSNSNSHMDRWAQLIAVALIAATIVPVHKWLRPRVEDLMHEPLDDAYTLITQFNRQIDRVRPTIVDTGDPSLAASIASALNVPYVSVVAGDIETSVTGTPPDDRALARILLSYQGIDVGYLSVAPRRAASQLSNRELQLLQSMAQQLSIALYAIGTSRQLQNSRAALVTAREEERRRIRRDLHDGLGPTLASMRMQLAAVARLTKSEPERASELLDEVRNGIDETTSDIRRLVYGLRPPLIDELGLIAAIRNHSSLDGKLDLSVSPDTLPTLPAAVEVALYRIASEAIHNASKHSAGKHCTVVIDVATNEVRMTIADDGRGLPEPLVEGVGVAAMRERAAEIGGVLELIQNDGTTITTVVPLS